MAQISLRDGEQARLEITKEQEKQISQLYRRVYLDLKKQVQKIPQNGTTSDAIRKSYLNKLIKQLKEAYASLGEGLEKQIQKGIQDTAQAVVDSGNSQMGKITGLNLKGAYSYVPQDIVSLLSTGKLYGGGWTLSGAIWGYEQKALDDINTVVAEGVAANKSAYEIAKDLEKYVDPSAKKDWEWSKVYPGTNKRVDYNAQRLARTMVSHAYQQSLLSTTKHNPFVKGYRWRSSHNSKRVCEICEKRDGKVYTSENLPMDHPNGMCTFLVEMDDLEDIADSLADWVKGGKNQALDSWAKVWGITPLQDKDIDRKDGFRYHATRASSLVGIIEKGILPSRGMLGDGVYFALSPKEAVEWTKETSTGGETVLRVALDYLMGKDYEEYSAEEDPYGVAEGLISDKIPLDQIQIKVGDEWWSLAYYADQRKGSIYNKLTAKTKKKVDKLVEKEWEEKLAKFR